MRAEIKSAMDRAILRAVVGSTVHGIHVGDGIEDRDEMGVFIEDLDESHGLRGTIEHYIYRTAAEREGRHDAKSRAGDLDLTLYTLRKYVTLALKGNPSILLLLFVPRDAIIAQDARGVRLQEMADRIVSREAGKAFLGYVRAQRERLLGLRGQKDVNRPELVEQYGFDTKYAAHALRLCLQGIELMRTGRITLPMPETDRQFVRGVRTGALTIAQVVAVLESKERELLDAYRASTLQPQPDIETVEQWMLRLYLEAWKARDDSWRGQSWAGLVPHGVRE